jgi:regulatory protein
MTGEGGRLDSCRRDEPAAGGAEEDAVRQAERWLAERGIMLPPDPTDATGPGEASLLPVARPGRRPQTRSADRPREATEVAAPEPPIASGPAADAPSERSTSASGDPLDPDADPEAIARTIVLRKLAVQARTRAELSKALKAKQVPEAAAEAVLDRMEAVGLIDDQGFARDWVESRQQRRHLSRSALRRELTTKGVDRDQIDAALEPVDGEAELSAARDLAAKKVRSMGALEHQVRYRRLAGVLGRRGFSPGVISRVVAEFVSTVAD